MSDEQELEAEIEAELEGVQAADQADQDKYDLHVQPDDTASRRRDQNGELLAEIGDFLAAIHGIYTGDSDSIIAVTDQALATATKILKEIEES